MSSFRVQALTLFYTFKADILAMYCVNIYLVNIFFNVFTSKKSIKISCRILQLFTIASVPFEGDVSSFISGALWLILLFKIVYNFFVVVSAWSSISLYNFQKSFKDILFFIHSKMKIQNLRHKVERAKCFAVIDLVFIFPKTTAPAWTINCREEAL